MVETDADAEQVKGNSHLGQVVVGIRHTHREWPLEQVDVGLAVAVIRCRSNLVVGVAAGDSWSMVRLVMEGKLHTVVEAVRMDL